MIPHQTRGLLGRIALAGVMLLYGCATPPGPAPTPTPSTAPPKSAPLERTAPRTSGGYKVGLLLPLSGEHKALGKALSQAAELSLFEKNDNVTLLMADTRGTKDGAREAAKHVLSEGADIILGPVFSEAVKAAAAEAAKDKVPILAFSNNRAVAKNGVYVLGFDPAQQLERVVRFAATKGLTHITAYVPKNADGELARDVLTSLQRDGLLKGSNTVFYDPKSPGTLSYKTTPGTEALLITEGGQALSRVISALIYHDEHVGKYQFLGSGQWDTPATRAEETLKGAWFAAPNPGARAGFEKTFLETYGYTPPRLATLSYDAVTLVVTLLKHFPKKPFTKEVLERTQGFSGIDGAFRLRENGTTERHLSILEVTPEVFQVIDPAPRTFER